MASSTAMPGRNEPCPCGSGRKYKQCHGAAPVDTGGEPFMAVGIVMRWLDARHRRATRALFEGIVTAWWPEDLPREEAPPLDDGLARMLEINVWEWLLIEEQLEIGGVVRHPLEHARAARALTLSPAQHAYLEALLASPLKLYTVTDVRPGEGLVMVDALDPHAPPLTVQERAGSQSMEPGLILGARVVPQGDHLELSGALYPFAPLWEGQVVDALADLSEDVAGEPDAQRAVGHAIASSWMRSLVVPADLPQLTDAASGEPIEFTTDRYRVKDAAALRDQLDAHPGLEREGPGQWVQLEADAAGTERPTMNLSLAQDGRSLEVFYRTRALAETGRAWLEREFGRTLRFLSRESLAPAEALERHRSGESSARAEEPASAALPPEALSQVMEQVIRRTYANWADEPLPALRGQTPRQAARTPAGAERVRGLIRSYEAGEARSAAQQQRKPVSFGFLWTAAGLEPNTSPR